MKTPLDKERLTSIANTLISDTAEIGDWVAVLNELEPKILDLISFERHMQDIGKGYISLDSGKAISPIQAAFCLKEYTRTRMFIKGLHTAILEQLAHAETNQPVRVLYAGCGPYALLALPLAALFPPEQLTFTLLDINEESLASATSLFTALKLSESLQDVIQTDATKFELPNSYKPNIIVTETMNVALGKEPQVSIARNLVTQAPDAILIPQNIAIEATLIDLSKEHVFLDSNHTGVIPQTQRDRIWLGTVFTLNKQTINAWKDITTPQLPANAIDIPNFAEKYTPMLLTNIDCYANHSLRDYDSSLTTPTRLPTQTSPANKCIQFAYTLGRDPQLSIIEINDM